MINIDNKQIAINILDVIYLGIFSK